MAVGDLVCVVEGLCLEGFVYCLEALGFASDLWVLLPLVALMEDFALEGFSVRGLFPLLGQLL